VGGTASGGVGATAPAATPPPSYDDLINLR